jgi:hypothetical protein
LRLRDLRENSEKNGMKAIVEKHEAKKVREVMRNFKRKLLIYCSAADESLANRF